MRAILFAAVSFALLSPAFGASMVKCADGTFTNTGCSGAPVRNDVSTAAPRPVAPDYVCRPGDWACLSAVQGAQARAASEDQRRWLDDRRTVERDAAQREAEKRYQRQLMDEARRGR